MTIVWVMVQADLLLRVMVGFSLGLKFSLRYVECLDKGNG